jgi:hypothetical protein
MKRHKDAARTGGSPTPIYATTVDGKISSVVIASTGIDSPAYPRRSCPPSDVTRFSCPHCAASYQLVPVEAEDAASDCEITCLRCHGPLPGRVRSGAPLPKKDPTSGSPGAPHEPTSPFPHSLSWRSIDARLARNAACDVARVPDQPGRSHQTTRAPPAAMRSRTESCLLPVRRKSGSALLDLKHASSTTVARSRIYAP